MFDSNSSVSAYKNIIIQMLGFGPDSFFFDFL